MQRLRDWAQRKALGQTLPKADVQRFRQSSLQADYAALLHALTASQVTARQNTDNTPAEG